MKCSWCGKEVANGREKYCSADCAYMSRHTKYKIKSSIQRTAKKYDFELKNLEQITNAKMRFFKDKGYKRCPCDADNHERYCGSPLCLHDVVEYGHCHCNLFWKKK